MLAAYNQTIWDQVEKRTELLRVLISELQDLVDKLQSPGLGDVIGTLDAAIEAANDVIDDEQG